jgi:hypothetical protein
LASAGGLVGRKEVLVAGDFGAGLEISVNPDTIRADTGNIFA